MRNRLLAIDDTVLHPSVICAIGDLTHFQTTGARSVDAGTAFKSFCDWITLDLSPGEPSGVAILILLAELQCRTPVILISGSEHETCQEILEFGNYAGLTLYPPMTKSIDLVRLRDSFRDIAASGSVWKLPPSAESQRR